MSQWSFEDAQQESGIWGLVYKNMGSLAKCCFRFETSLSTPNGLGTSRT